MTCYVCVQLIKFIYIFICICFISNTVLLKVTIMHVFNIPQDPDIIWVANISLSAILLSTF